MRVLINFCPTCNHTLEILFSSLAKLDSSLESRQHFEVELSKLGFIVNFSEEDAAILQRLLERLHTNSAPPLISLSPRTKQSTM